MEKEEQKNNEILYVTPEGIALAELEEYSFDIGDYFNVIPEIAKPLLDHAKISMNRIERLLYSTPAFVNIVRASVPEEALQAILSIDQKNQIAQGALKLMTKKDGTLMASLVNPETNRIVSTVPLESVKLTPEISQALTNFATQVQLAQIAEDIQTVQIAIEEVRQGQEYDRLAMAYSCQQKLLQAMRIRDPEKRNMMLMNVVSDAEDSRNLLMQSQRSNVEFIKGQPESFWGKIMTGAKPDIINKRMCEIRESLSVVNMVSLAEAMAYQEMEENDAAVQSLNYYASFIKNTYLESKGLVERLDLIDPSPENYWSKTLPVLEKRIVALPVYDNRLIAGGERDESECI